MAAELTPRLSIVTLGVHDLPLMKLFYEKLGLAASPAGNEHVSFFQLNGTVLALYGYDELAADAGLKPSPAQAYRGFSLAWNADSREHVDRILNHAAAQGAEIAKPAEEVFWGGYSGYFKDPEGNLWEVAHNPFFPFDEKGQLKLP